MEHKQSDDIKKRLDSGNYYKLCMFIQGVTGGMCETSGECSLGQTIPNPKHLYPKLNGYGDNGLRNVWASGVSTYCMPTVMLYLSNAPVRQRDMVM